MIKPHNHSLHQAAYLTDASPASAEAGRYVAT